MVAAAAAASSLAQTANMDICICCADDISMELIEMKCCKKPIHRQCILAWLAVSNRCVYCRGQADTLAVVDYPVIERMATASVDSPFVTVRHSYEITSPSPVHKRIRSVGSKRTLYDNLKVEETPLRTTDKHREDSMKKKRAQQEQQHKKMQRQFSNSLQALEVTPGAVLVVKVDSRDISHAIDIPGIAWRIGNGGGVRIATQYGILSSRNRRGVLYLSYNKWCLHSRADEMAVLPTELQQVRNLILRGEFIESEQQKCTLQECHKQLINSTSPNWKSKGGCNCKGGQCKPNVCKCICNGHKCTSACSCNGNCTANTNNGK